MASAMRRLHARDGIPISEQIRRALAAWLPTKKITASKKKKERP
jgi:hypothetical protein